MYEEIQAGKYEVTMSRPYKSDYNNTQCGHSLQTHNFCSQCGEPMIKLETAYKKDMLAYNYHVAAKKTLFKDDSMQYVGIPSTYPKYNEVWDKAWEDGHSTGLYSVVQELEELVDCLVF